MNSTLSKILQALSFLMMGVSVILVIMFYVKNAGISADADFATQIKEFGPSLEYFIIWTYILFFVAAGGSIVFPVINMVTNPKGAVKTLVGVIGFAIVILISYFLADDSILNIPGYTGPDNIPSMLKFAGTSLYTMYIMMVLSFISIIYVEVAKIFK